MRRGEQVEKALCRPAEEGILRMAAMMQRQEVRVRRKGGRVNKADRSKVSRAIRLVSEQDSVNSGVKSQKKWSRSVGPQKTMPDNQKALAAMARNPLIHDAAASCRQDLVLIRAA